MMIFFANNRALKKYFKRICYFMKDGSTTYEPTKASLPRWSALFDLSPAFVRNTIMLAEKDAVGKNSPNFFLKKPFYPLMIRWIYACDCRALLRQRPSAVVVWNGLRLRRSLFVAAAKRYNIPCYFMENGLLPDTTVCDPKGVNALNSVPREVDFFRNRSHQPFSMASSLTVRVGKTTKKAASQALPENYIFVPFQVDSDTQIVMFSPWIKNMEQLFTALVDAVANSPYQVVFKEHPSSANDYSYLHPRLPKAVGMFANDYLTQTLIEKAAAVVTINSTVGIESLMLGKKVIVAGEAFYDLDGLTLSVKNQQELVQSVAALATFCPDQTLRDNFLNYLQDDYLIPGSWKTASEEHCLSVVERLNSFSNTSIQAR